MASNAKILIVDDQGVNRRILQQMVVGLGHRAIMASNGLNALDAVRLDPPDLILLDLQMPEVSGLEVLRVLKRHPDHCHIPILILSREEFLDEIARCLREGADDFVSKPFNSVLLSARIASSLAKKRLHDLEQERFRAMETVNNQLQTKVAEQLRQICSAQQATIFALSKLAESRDSETGQHLERIREYSRLLAQSLAQSNHDEAKRIDENFIENLYNASPLHDIGKVGIPDAILRKPGPLTPCEFDIIKLHTVIGAQTLRQVDLLYPGNAFIEFGTMIAEGHHERWDGKGYPYGASGELIPLAARLVSLADVYDALTAKRCYKPSFTHAESVRLIVEGRGTQFDPSLVDLFLEVAEGFRLIHERLRDSESLDTPNFLQEFHSMRGWSELWPANV